MKSNSSRILKLRLRALAVTGALLLGGLAYCGVFQAEPAYAMLPPGGYVMWSDVTAIGGEYEYDHNNPAKPYVVGIGCSEYGYPDGDYGCYVTTTVTGPNGSSANYSSYPNTSYSIAHAYLRMTGAVGRYNVDTLHYSVSNISGGEEYLGCTHTFINADSPVELYYKFLRSDPFPGPGNRPMQACVYINCPSNTGKPCYSSSGFSDFRERSNQCPTGVVLVTQRVWKFIIEKCKIINHHDFFSPFVCP